MKTLFELGQTVATANAANSLDPRDVARGLNRHSMGDWGEVSPDDWQENELSLKEGFRLHSVYHTEDGRTFWIITESDRSVTTVLLPEDY